MTVTSELTKFCRRDIVTPFNRNQDAELHPRSSTILKQYDERKRWTNRLMEVTTFNFKAR